MRNWNVAAIGYRCGQYIFTIRQIKLFEVNTQTDPTRLHKTTPFLFSEVNKLKEVLQDMQTK